MDVSVQLIFQNYGGRADEAEMWRADAPRGPRGAARLRQLFAAEHHFIDYSACPDNLQFLSWLAARTTSIRLATGAFILPWNNPLRVAEKIALLDHLSPVARYSVSGAGCRGSSTGASGST